jgi:zinc transport system substrate-binding protein
MIAIIDYCYGWRVRTVATLATVVALLAACGCGGGGEAAAGKTVVAAFYPLAWVAEQVGGPSVHVVDLTPAGAEPHDIELTPRDVQEIHDADLVLYLGRGFQPAVEKAVAGRDGPSLDLLAGQALRGAQGTDATEALDPHVWLDPTRLATMATAVGRALGEKRRAALLAARLRRLDQRLAAGLASCRRREIVTSHAAFGYFARRYGLEQVALSGLSPEVEPGPKDLERLVQEVRRSRANTVFFETLVSPKLAQTIAREAGVGTAVLDPLEGLNSSEAAAGDDYVSIMTSNLQALRTALACR